MKIHSMTAFARVQNQNESYDLICEMRSINHRFLEMSVYLPELLRNYEMQIRERLRKNLQRGKVECSIRYRNNNNQLNQQLKINFDLIKELCAASEQIARFMPVSTPANPADFLRFPNVLETKEINSAALQEPLLAVVDATLNELIQARSREGEELKKFFTERFALLQQALEKIRERLPQILINQREQLLARFKEAKLELNQERLEQELLLFTQKIDVTEEIERTGTHIVESRRILQEGGAVGRRLDFLLQELNREANTIASKSVDEIVTHTAVEMKVLIEQIREQVQNVE